MPQITKEEIIELKKKMLDYVKANGPVIPVNLSKVTGSSTIFAGAVLSEMISQRLVKLTNAKIGGSPLYYCAGQEEKITRLREYLGQRPKQAFDLLKEQKILHDRSCEPWHRVALREIKDFAMPIYIQINGEQEIFWRWYLMPEEEAIIEIKRVLDEEEKKQKPQEPKRIEEVIAVQTNNPEIAKEEKTIEQKSEPIKEKTKPKKKKEKIDIDNFYKGILKLFADKNIDILEQKIIKQGKDFNFVIKIPSNIGSLNYLVIARDKKKVSDSDITMAFSEGLNIKLPVIYLSQGELSKKAGKFLESNMKGVVFKKI